MSAAQAHDIKNRFANIKVFQRNGFKAVHKPLVLLWSIARCLKGKERLVAFREAEPELQHLMKLFNVSAYPLFPFWHLLFDRGIWEIPDKDLLTIGSNGKPLINSLRPVHGGFPQEVFEALNNDLILALDIAFSLVAVHFPGKSREIVLAAAGFDVEFDFVREKKIRDPKFAVKVLRAYGQQCVVCDFSLRWDKNPMFRDRSIAIDAAHIKPHAADGPDLVSNGLAMCALHHRLFDAGAFTLSQDRKIKVSGLLTGPGYEDTLGQVNDKEARPPSKKIDLPNPEFLEWHDRWIFEKGIGQSIGNEHQASLL